LTDLIIAKNVDVLGPELASREQIEELVQRILIGGSNTPDNTNTSMDNVRNNHSSSSSALQKVSGNAAAGVASTTVDMYGDLNKASDEVVQQAKARMDVDFNAKRLKPGDDGYQWNKEVDFEPPTAVSEWDDDDE